MDRKADLALSMIEVIQKSGRALEAIDKILEMDVFNNLSKHNPYFEHEDEKINDKLFDLRGAFRMIEDSLNDIRTMLEVDKDLGY